VVAITGRGGLVTVSLVGAGPGDPGLLTLRGAELIGRAEVVVYDRLIAHELLELAPEAAERIDVGKVPGGSDSSDRQREINRLLVDRGRAGRRVVRLKGGDPFVFGRGGEEAEALRQAGVDYEIVPGVSSAFAAPAAAGIPVTHRGLATSVSVVTARVGEASTGGVDWAALGRVGGTLVILMGMSERKAIVDGLVAGGRPADTPVAVVHWGTTPDQKVVRSTLAGLADIELPPPAAIVVGAVAGLDLAPPDPVRSDPVPSDPVPSDP
jgi:uroporphyrin-III C-methyltransferase